MADIQAFLTDPNVAFALFVVGALGIAIELVHPNSVTGVLGALAIILSLVGFSSLPVNAVALLLIAFAFVLFVAETQITSHGALTIAAVVALVLGAVFLYSDTPTASGEVAHVSPVLILGVTAMMTVLMGLVSIAAVRVRRMRAPKGIVGTPPDPGTPGVVQAPLEPLGTVQLGGETWSARTPSDLPLPRDTPVRLVGFDGLIAVVEPADPLPPTVVPAPAAPLPAERT